MFNVKILTNMPQTALFGNGLVLCLNTFLLCKPIAKKVVAGVQVIDAQNFYIQSNLVIRNVLIRNKLVFRNHFL